MATDTLTARLTRAVSALRTPPRVAARVDSTPARPAQTRGGGWFNTFTGMGVRGVDSQQHTGFGPPRILTSTDCWNMYRGDRLNARIIDLPINEALRQGYEVQYDGQADEEAHKALETLPIDGSKDALGATAAISCWLKWGRVARGSALFLVCSDGLSHEPLSESSPGLQSVRVLTSEGLRVVQRGIDPARPNFGKPEVWEYMPPTGGQYLRIHDSRLITFKHRTLPEEATRAMGGEWSDSDFVGLFSTLAGMATTENATHRLVSRWELVVRSMAGLGAAMAEGGNAVLDRLGFDALLSSVHRQEVIESDVESIERHTASAQGLADLVRLDWDRLSSKTGIPVTLLMGQAPAGLSTDDASGTRFFYDSVVGEYQRGHVRRGLERLCTLLEADGRLKPGWSVSFNSLYQMDPLQAAQIDKTRTEALSIATGGASFALPAEAAERMAADGLFKLDEVKRTEQAAEGEADIDPIARLQQGRLALDALHTEATAAWVAGILGSPVPTPAQMDAYWTRQRGSAGGEGASLGE